MRVVVASAFASAVALVAFLGSARDAHAAGPAYRLEPELDAPIILVGGAVTAGFLFLEETPGETCERGCDRAKVVVVDRWAAGNHSVAWERVGDIATGATVLFGPLVLTLHEGLRDGLHDSLVVGEAVLLSSALQVLSSYAVPRARPRAYAGEEVPVEERTNANAARSFFSGHTADAVASVVASARTLQKLGHPRLAGFVLGFGIAGSTLAGLGRVMSGGHFPTDVRGRRRRHGLRLARPFAALASGRRRADHARERWRRRDGVRHVLISCSGHLPRGTTEPSTLVAVTSAARSAASEAGGPSVTARTIAERPRSRPSSRAR